MTKRTEAHQKECGTEGCENLTDSPKKFCAACINARITTQARDAGIRHRAKMRAKHKYCPGGHCTPTGKPTEIFGHHHYCDVCRPIMAKEAYQRSLLRSKKNSAYKWVTEPKPISPVEQKKLEKPPPVSTKPVLTLTQVHVQALAAMGLKVREGAFPAGDVKIYTPDEIKALVEAGAITDLDAIPKPVRKMLLPYDLG